MGLELVFQRVETQVLGRVREKADQASQDSKFKTNIDADVLHDKLFLFFWNCEFPSAFTLWEGLACFVLGQTSWSVGTWSIAEDRNCHLFSSNHETANALTARPKICLS